MFYTELGTLSSGLIGGPSKAIGARLTAGLSYLDEPEQVLVGLTAPALGVKPAYDDLRQKVEHWEGIRETQSRACRFVQLVKDGIPTGERGLAQCITPAS